MGKAAREKRRNQQMQKLDKPKWAGANGFDQAWNLAEQFVDLQGDVIGNMIRATADMAEAKCLVFEKVLEDRYGESYDVTESEAYQNVIKEGLSADGIKDKYKEIAGSYHYICKAFQLTLRDSTPILFSHLNVPEADSQSTYNLRLPFPNTTCDFVSDTGMSLPIIETKLKDSDHSAYIGLSSVTFEESEDGNIDIVPIINVMTPTKSTKSFLYGIARLGADLPKPLHGMRAYKIDDFSIWGRYDPDEPNTEEDFVNIFVKLPALIACGALHLLEAVNVDLQDADLPRQQRRQAFREGAKPALEVVVKNSSKHSVSTGENHIDYQHRWTVRGHWKHFTKGPVFNSNPRRRVYDPVHGECVKVWCHPHVRGPEDKPLVLKSRRVAIPYSSDGQ